MAVTDLGQAQGMAWARSAGSCFTSSPLAELQEWQGGKKAPVPVSLEATTGEGWKSRYGQLEKQSLDGLTLTVNYNDGSKKSYSKPFNEEEWSFSPAEGTTIWGPRLLYCTYIKEADEAGNHLSTQLPIVYINKIMLEGPTRKSYAFGEKLSLEGLVVKAQCQRVGSSYYEVVVPEKLGTTTDGYTMALGNTQFTSETIPPAINALGYQSLEISYGGYKDQIPIRWMKLQQAITKIARIDNGFGFSPDWKQSTEPPYSPEILLADLLPVTATLEDGTSRSNIEMDQLISLALPRSIFVESRYDGLEETVIVNAASFTGQDSRNVMLKGKVEDHKINAYRYLYGTTQATATPVSEWLSITPPRY